MRSKKTLLTTINGEPSWKFASNCVEACVTRHGGHMAPVTFDRKNRAIRPFSTAPWAGEPDARKLPSILRVLRGDFFCLPFGGNSTPWRGEKHPIHGETANAPWQFESLNTAKDRVTLHLSLETQTRKGRVEKEITLVHGQNVIYSKHTLSGMSGPMNPGHHAMLKFPDAPGSAFIATSPFVYGQVFPGEFEMSAQFGYSSLKPGAEFTSLQSVPMAAGGTTSLATYPARRGFEDLVMLVADDSAPFAWTAVTFIKDKFVWFSLKNPRVLRQTIFWISNGGRHYPPWSSRHTSIMGLEDVTSFFHSGLAESAAPNPISAMGFPTCLKLTSKHPTVIPYIMAVAPLPRNFDRVVDIAPSPDAESVRLRAANGREIEFTVNTRFLHASHPA